MGPSPRGAEEQDVPQQRWGPEHTAREEHEAASQQPDEQESMTY